MLKTWKNTSSSVHVSLENKFLDHPIRPIQLGQLYQLYGFVTASQSINFHSFSFQMTGYLALFLLLVFNEVFKRYLSCGFIASNYYSRVLIDPC